MKVSCNWILNWGKCISQLLHTTFELNCAKKHPPTELTGKSGWSVVDIKCNVQGIFTKQCFDEGVGLFLLVRSFKLEWVHSTE